MSALAVALLALLALIGLAALTMLHRTNTLLHDIREQGAVNTDESLPAIRAIASDVLNLLEAAELGGER